MNQLLKRQHLQANLEWLRYDLAEQFPHWDRFTLQCESWRALQSPRAAIQNGTMFHRIYGN
jgi:hypothetical protein